MLDLLAGTVNSATASPELATRWQLAVFPAGYDLFITGRAGAKGSLRDGAETAVVVAPEPFDLAPATAA